MKRTTISYTLQKIQRDSKYSKQVDVEFKFSFLVDVES